MLVLLKIIVENNYDLDIKNPNKIKKGGIRTSKEILDSLIQIENKIFERLNNLKHEISKGFDNGK